MNPSFAMPGGGPEGRDLFLEFAYSSEKRFKNIDQTPRLSLLSFFVWFSTERFLSSAPRFSACHLSLTVNLLINTNI
jgi:hypothetical protein